MPPDAMTDRLSIPWICAHCGGVTVAELTCACQERFDLVAIRRRHAEALTRAVRTDAAVGRARRVA